jgi:hypothetical protein
MLPAVIPSTLYLSLIGLFAQNNIIGAVVFGAVVFGAVVFGAVVFGAVVFGAA